MHTLTLAQQTTLRNAIVTSVDPVVVNALNNQDGRLDDVITAWCNEPTATDAWLKNARTRELFAATNTAKFDALTAGKRDAWRLILDMANEAPFDFGVAKSRQDVVDVWGSAVDGKAVLTALRQKATRAEVILGGPTETTETITGLDRAFAGVLAPHDISETLNMPG